MTYESCRFLFHQFIQRDKAHEIIADADALTPLSAALVRGSDINRLDQIMSCISGQFVQIRSCTVNEKKKNWWITVDK